MSGFYHGSGTGGGSSSSSVGLGGGGVGGVGGVATMNMNYNAAQQQQQSQQHYHHQQQQQQQQQASQSMTIDEMRLLHRTALSEAESKRTELRLVLASRYRELVGSSDEVLHMRERAVELHTLIGELPSLVDRVVGAAKALEKDNDHGKGGEMGEVGAAALGGDGNNENEDKSSRKLFVNNDDHPAPDNDEMGNLVAIRGELSRLPRDIYRCLDNNDVHGAASSLIALFDIIVACCNCGSGSSISGDAGEGGSTSDSSSGSSLSSSFPLAIALASSSKTHSGLVLRRDSTRNNNALLLLDMQMKMVYLHVQTLPSRTVLLARRVLLKSAAEVGEIGSGRGRVGGGGGVRSGGDGAKRNGSMGRRRGGGGAHAVAAALSALDLLDVGATDDRSSSTRATKLIDLYYESKAHLLDKLLNKLALPSSSSSSSSTLPSSTTSSSLDAASVTQRAEIILSKIVMILQYDVILYPYQIFVLRKFRINDNNDDGKIARRKNAGSAEECQIISSIMSTLPPFDPDLLKSKASRFLEAHLPLIRTKVKSVLMMIAGTTASRLGHIRQTLYDKTDGVECMAALDSCGVCTWEEAVGGMVDIRLVNHGMTTGLATTSSTTNATIGDEQRGMNGQGSTTTTMTPRRFSLWGALFSNTFSSLVHSLLTSSFHSVHARVVSTLRTSLARAPPFECMLPHEARRNALRIASDLDASLRRVSDDAHELLVHAEEREESERRLRQSLYVQTCEIMGRLLNELRRMLVVGGGGRDEDATKVLIVGRLCHLLKFRLKSLPTLLDPKNSPAATYAAGGGGGKSNSGMITLVELRSSFDLADDDDDGLISFDEAMEAMESAFSGTHSHGAEMVRDTLLLSHPAGSSGMGEDSTTIANHSNASYASSTAHNKSAPENVTLSELALLSARGLRHDASGPESALGTVQSSLDGIVDRCFKEWARAALSPSLRSFTKTLRENMGVASTVSEVEWRRLHGLTDKDDDIMLKTIQEMKGDESKLNQSRTTVGEVSPHVVSYLLSVSGVLNRSVCPADSLPPVPSLDCAKALGISIRSDEDRKIPNMMVTIRRSLLDEALTSISQSLRQEITSESLDDCATKDNGTDHILKKCSPSSLIQLDMDVKFIHHCFFERHRHDTFSPPSDNSTDDDDESRSIIDSLSQRLSASVVDALGKDASLALHDAISESQMRVFTSCDLFLTPLFGEDVQKGETSHSSTTASSSTSSLSFTLNPMASSRRFILLPIQAEKSQSELQLRGKYGKKVQEEKVSNSTNGAGGKDSFTTGGNALGTGFGFLSSMLSTKNIKK
ncbi:hypothetical protein ACHAWU_006410 [Discostella pseudostelligera]|uniref:Conserved oligomeric Golgi complex subunit 1 n=1 Tax=Discostella pseudostelligera TaxID=259834 RepID=A0ABD3M7A4_9STRA